MSDNSRQPQLPANRIPANRVRTGSCLVRNTRGMARYWAYALSLLIIAASMLSVSPGLAAPSRPQPSTPSESVADVLDDQRTHGYINALAALQRLQAASDTLAADAPVDLRRRYYRALVEFSLLTGQPELTTRALASLDVMATDEQCVDCRIQWLIGQARRDLDQQAFKAALDKLTKARALLPENDSSMRPQVFALEAVVRGKIGDLATAIELGAKAADLAREHGNRADQVSTLAMLVGLNADLGDIKRAKKLAAETYTLAEAMDFRPAMATIRLNQGHLYALDNKRSAQLSALNDALRIAQDDPNLVDIEILSLSNLADYHLAQPGQEQQALALATRGAAVADQADMPVYRAIALTNMGIASARLGRPEDGIDLLQQAIAIFKDNGFKRYVAAANLALIKVLEADGQYREALERMHALAALNDKFTRQERENAVLELQEKYAAESKSREIQRLSAENVRKQADIAARAREQHLWVALALSLAMMAVLLAWSIRRERRTNKRLTFDNAALTEKTVIDPLTGVFNRRHLQTLMMHQELHFERRRDDPPEQTLVALLMLDADHFKHINDHYGHVSGDAVLVAIANRLRGLARHGDALVRWGGEEFVLMLPGTDVDGLLAMSARILNAISGQPVMLDDTAIAVTVSGGGVVYDQASEQHWEDLLHIADQAMYLSKSGGRNRITCVTAIDPEARMNRVRTDLAAAQDKGEIKVQTVLG